jgi:transposase InsO family protein
MKTVSGRYGREKKTGWSKLRNTKIKFVIFANYYYGYEIKGELSGTQGRRGEIRNACRIFVRNVKGNII